MLVIDQGTHHARIRKHTIIQSPEIARSSLYFVKEGALRLYIINAEGKQFTVGILGKGSTFGEVESFSLNQRNSMLEKMALGTVKEKIFS
ncbi:cyclic nucleotide-binding domain-containing protein [Paenibacillus durus]|uniref:Cyclic nucleotide-binding domain-containing protein n=1 Tax=Paenibacillus durus TaxID=44251 RepID=A0A089HM18_PAEDU|nr:cyclic nucleotide-binding domain-containing protein [Paenibacillus durus]AIQ12996.1 hypothetical protein PDUR_14550 [Paenibacillus durus]